MITCKVEGAAHFVGMDGGDLTDLSLYGESKRRMFNGKLLVVLGADKEGEVTVTLTAENGIKATQILTVK